MRSMSVRFVRRVLRQADHLAQLRMCHEVSTMWRHDRNFSDSASPICFMCLRVGRCSWANFVMKICVLCSRVANAFPGACQLIDWNICGVQLLRRISLLRRLGLLAACRSRFANRHVMVSPWTVSLAWDGPMEGIILDGSK
jgi:hypothetical protein